MILLYINGFLQLKSSLAYFLIKKNYITIKYHFRVEIFLAIMDKQLQELNSRSNNQVINLLTLNSVLISIDTYKIFAIVRFLHPWKCKKIIFFE